MQSWLEQSGRSSKGQVSGEEWFLYHYQKFSKERGGWSAGSSLLCSWPILGLTCLSLSAVIMNFCVCLLLSSHISTVSTCDTRLSPESAWASPCQKDHQHLTALFPSDSGPGRCYKLKLSFVAAAPGTSWQRWGLEWGNSEDAAQRSPLPVAAPPSGERGCVQRKVVLSYVKNNIFLVFLPCVLHVKIMHSL